MRDLPTARNSTRVGSRAASHGVSESPEKPARKRQKCRRRCMHKSDFPNVLLHRPFGPRARREKYRIAGSDESRAAVGLLHQNLAFDHVGGLVAVVQPVEPAGRAIPKHRDGASVGAGRQNVGARNRVTTDNPALVDRTWLQIDRCGAKPNVACDRNSEIPMWISGLVRPRRRRNQAMAPADYLHCADGAGESTIDPFTNACRSSFAMHKLAR